MTRENKTLNRWDFEEIVNMAGIDPDDIRDDYSGRGMFGRGCVGVTPGTAGGLDSPLVGSTTATYDEHGEWMAKLFEIDPDAIIATYDGVEDFYRQTQETRTRGFQRASFPWLEQRADELRAAPQEVTA